MKVAVQQDIHSSKMVEARNNKYCQSIDTYRGGKKIKWLPLLSHYIFV